MSYESLGAQVYAASELGSRITPWWNVRTITPRGETGALQRYPRRFGTPIDGGPTRPVATFFGRKIGPQGAEGPVTALGDDGSRPFIQMVVAAGIVAATIYLFVKPLRMRLPKENPVRKLLGMSPTGERLFGELNPEDIRYYHVFAVKDGKERYIGQVLDTGGAYFSVFPSGKQRIAHTAKEAAEALSGGS